MSTLQEFTRLAPTAAEIPAQAGHLVAQLGERALVHDLYDEVGAPIYHDIAGSDVHEIREMMGAVRPFGGPVLELAAGSGRLTFPLLALGRVVTAVELSPDMLDLLDERLGRGPAVYRDRCTTVREDMRHFHFDHRFGVVLLGTTTISLLDADGRQQLYTRVLQHLTTDGVFLVSTVDLGELDQPSANGEPVQSEDLVTGTSGRRYRLFEFYSPGAETRSVTVIPEDEFAGDGDVTVCTTKIGVIGPDQLEAELLAAGFEITARTNLPGLDAQHEGTLFTAARAQTGGTST